MLQGKDVKDWWTGDRTTWNYNCMSTHHSIKGLPSKAQAFGGFVILKMMRYLCFPELENDGVPAGNIGNLEKQGELSRGRMD